MFNTEFYPTPLHVIEQMGLDPKGKVILEPSAGKGDIVDYCKNLGAHEVLTMELNKDLQQIVKTKSRFIGENFFDCKPELISHVNAIYMNPPFSNADKHIIHAFKIAPDGCEIIALCNWETISKSYLYPQLNNLIYKYGNAFNLENCFSNAERKTNVEVGLVKLYKPLNDKENDFNGFFMEEDEEEEQGEGIMQHNEVRALVNRYVYCIKVFDKMKEELNIINDLVLQINMHKLEMNVGYNETVTSREDFMKILQKNSWKHIFNKLNLEKYVTSGVMSDINKFVETQTKVPFTMKNIYKMLEIIVGTRESRFNQALEEAIDNFTKHTKENRFGVEGWKTNSGYMLNKKFICEGIANVSYSGTLNVTYDSYYLRKITDLVKVLCVIMGKNYDDIGSLYRFNEDKENKPGFPLEPNTWYEYGFFEVKFFKKGTAHFKFKDDDAWYRLNKAYGELKGFTLSEKYK